jgi:S-adenosylmethionine:diacylglycerol 3-amino-3-carboxypropyl transferase
MVGLSIEIEIDRRLLADTFQLQSLATAVTLKDLLQSIKAIQKPKNGSTLRTAASAVRSKTRASTPLKA